MADTHLETLHGYLTATDQRVSAEIRPDPSGGAQVSATAGSDLESLVTAYRAVATIGAKPVRAQVPEDLHGPCDLLRIAADVAVDAITVIGELDDIERRTPMALAHEGDLLYWLGMLLGSVPDNESLTQERKVAEVMVAASRDGLLNAALDVQVGGIAATIASMAMLDGVGARFWIPDQVPAPTALFDGGLGGVICVVPRTEELRFSDMCVARYLPCQRIGVVDGTRLEAQGEFIIEVSELRSR